MDNLVPALLLAGAAIPVAPAFSGVAEFDSKKGSLWRLAQNEIEPKLCPGFEVAGRVISRRSNINEALHGTSGEVHRTGVRALQSMIEGFGADPNHKIFPDDPTAHVAIDHESDSAEHLLLRDLVITLEQRSDSLG